MQAAYPGLSPLPAPQDHPENARYRADAERVLDIAPGEPGSYNAHVVICKAWPARNDRLLVAVPLIDPSVSGDDGHRADVEVMLVDAKTRQPVQRLRLPEAASDDAVMLRSLRLDTARYDLAPGNRAFGLRFTRESSSRAAPFGETTLSLFDLPEGDAGPLRLVLENVIVQSDGGEWDTNCAGEIASRAATLAMAPAASHGLQDMTVRETYETRTYREEKMDCVGRVTDKGTREATLRFDGDRYVVPPALRGLPMN